MVISLAGVVSLVVYLIVAALVFGLLFWLINYIGSQVEGEVGKLFVKAARIVLVVLAVLVLIGLLLSFTGAIPPVTFVR